MGRDAEELVTRHGRQVLGYTTSWECSQISSHLEKLTSGCFSDQFLGQLNVPMGSIKMLGGVVFMSSARPAAIVLVTNER